MRVRAALFDMGNTLWHVPREPDMGEVERLQGACAAPLMARWGVERIDPESFVRELWEAITEAYENIPPTFEDVDAAECVRRGLEHHGVTVTRDQCIEFMGAIYISARHLGWELWPDTIETLERLQKLGVAIGVVTNRPHTTDIFQVDLEEYGLAQYVDAAVCSADVGFVKPHPAPFVRALALLDVAPDEAVMVGDLLEADVRGSKALGMTAVWKRNDRAAPAEANEAAFTIGDLSELLGLGLFALPGS